MLSKLRILIFSILYFSTITLNAQNTTNEISLTKEEQSYLINKKIISMCIDPDWLPYESIQNNQHIGMTKDYFNIFQKQISIPIKLIETKTWNETLDFAQKRKCDIISLAMETNDRKKYMTFTNPYISTNLVIATRVDKNFSADIDEIVPNEKLGIVKGYAFFEILTRKYPQNQIVEVKDLNTGLEMVEKGELYGMIDSMITIGSKIQTNYPGRLVISSNFKEKWALGIAVRNDEILLFNIFNKLISKIDNNTHQAILNKWTSIIYQKKVDYVFMWTIVISGLFIIFIILYWVKLLKKEVKRREEVEKKLEILNKNLSNEVNKEVIRNREKDQLIAEQSKLASMGEMIGNISHQWRQPLSVISTGVTGMQLMKELGTLSDKEFYDTCQVVNENAQYLSRTIEDFRNFIKGDRVKQVFLLKDNISSFLQLVEGRFKSNHIDIILDLDESIEIDGYENELIQCLMSLANNARDALLEQEIEEKCLFLETYKKEENVIIIMKDNAGGIPVDVLPKIFEPYFTTKHQSQGTGLGLHLTYDFIVNGMSGTIMVKNEIYSYNNVEYLGAKFIITLPLT